jgi:NCS1 family nucleobase:cation symporter-1
MPNTIPNSSHVTTSQIIGWIVFLVICLPLIYVRPERAPKAIMVMNLLTMVTLVSIVIWSLAEAQGAGPLLSQSSALDNGSQLGWSMMGGINNVIGTVAPALSKLQLLVVVLFRYHMISDR